ncbi:MAG: ATP synthase subunit I [Cellulosilyticaceae bacterium]
MRKINKTFIKQNLMIIVMIAFTAVIYSVGLFMTDNILGWTTGIFFGLTIALLKIKLMENTFSKAVVMPEAKAKVYTQRHYMIRYLLTGVVLLVAAIDPSISILGVFFGLVSMKVGAYSQLWVVGK